MDDRTPVLIGIGTVTDRDGGRDAIEVMAGALESAVADSGCARVLASVDRVLVPRGTWTHADPGRALAERFGMGTVRTTLAELGVLQSTLIAAAAASIAAGDAEVVVVVGGEAAATARRAGAISQPLPGAAGEGAPPDEVLVPQGRIVSELEIARGFWTPAHQYALIERSLGRSPESLNETWASWSRVAAANPEAWRRDAYTPGELAWGAAGNPPVAHPYGRRHCSQMNVDQAAALILVSAATARSLGVSRDRWVFPWAVAESNLMVPLPERADPGRSPGFAAVARALHEATGTTIGEIDLVDLYSCFPSAVEVQRREFGFAADRVLTVTGGMSFAGGPFNNYVLQSTAAMARRLRERPGAVGLVTAISGMITKQGGALWSTEPRGDGYVSLDATAAAEAATVLAPIVADPESAAGPATVVTSTVVAGPGAARTWALVDLAVDGRTLVASDDPEVADAWSADAALGSTVDVRGSAFAPA